MKAPECRRNDSFAGAAKRYPGPLWSNYRAESYRHSHSNDPAVRCAPTPRNSTHLAMGNCPKRNAVEEEFRTVRCRVDPHVEIVPNAAACQNHVSGDSA